MKKYLFTMAVMAVFAIGFAASDDDSSSSPEKKEREYREVRGRTIEMAKYAGIAAAEEGANDLIRQGYSKSDLKGIAAQQARLKYKSVDCFKLDYLQKEFKEYSTPSDLQKLLEQCREAYIIGYMSALGN